MSSNHYEKLREQLLATSKWPLEYMFKFIVPNIEGRVEAVAEQMPSHGKISYKHTASLKFVSITCVAVMETVDQILDVTKKATAVEGVIVL
ncbi:MAG: hypothetical protein JEZ09_18040 [Salinivirgaceae bacterium]|nr:hypothetical protein [Salinivirgaceae bacterium]